MKARRLNTVEERTIITKRRKVHFRQGEKVQYYGNIK